jgi:hypothetical protein
MRILKITKVYLLLSLFLLGCSSTVSFSEKEVQKDNLLSSISDYQNILTGDNVCQDLTELGKILDMAAEAGIDPVNLNLEIPFLKTIFKNFDFMGAKLRYTSTAEYYEYKKTYDIPGGKAATASKTKDGAIVKEKTELDVADFLSAVFGSCILEDGRTEILVNLLFNMYAKFSIVPLALFDNTSFPEFINIDSLDFNEYKDCAGQIDTFILDKVKFLVINADLNQPVSGFLEGIFDLMAEEIPLCLMELIGNEAGGGDEEPAILCNTEFTMTLFGPEGGFYNFPQDGGFWMSNDTLSLDPMGLFFDGDNNAIMPSGAQINLWEYNPNTIIHYYEASSARTFLLEDGGYNTAPLGNGDYFQVSCPDGSGVTRTIFLNVKDKD